MTDQDKSFADLVLPELELAWLEGDVHSLRHAVFLCHKEELPLPTWVAEGVHTVLGDVLASWGERRLALALPAKSRSSAPQL